MTVGRCACAARLELFAPRGLPVLDAGDDLAGAIARALADEGFALADGDVVAVASKAVSRAEGRFVDLAGVAPSGRAIELAAAVRKDARLVELVLRESYAVSRVAPGALVVRHRLGFVTGDAGIDLSNAPPSRSAGGRGPWAILLPKAPDESAARIRAGLLAATGVDVGVVITDSFGRPFRVGTVGAAIGVAGLPAISDRRGEEDLFGRPLERTITALADQVAAAADLVAGQAAERRAAVVVRGLSFVPEASGAGALVRPHDQDLYA